MIIENHKNKEVENVYTDMEATGIDIIRVERLGHENRMNSERILM